MSKLEQQQIEQVMHQAYTKQVGEVLSDLSRYTKTSTRQVGLEVEYSIVEKGQWDCLQSKRDQVVDAHSWLDPELGASQIELHTDPCEVSTTGLSEMINQLKMRESAMIATAENSGLEIIRSGTNPILPISEITRTDKPKYKIVPDYYNSRRTATATVGNVEPIHVTDLSMVSIINALQVNVEAANAVEAVSLLNRSLALSPLLVAISGNSRYLENRDTGVSDLRMLAWSMAVDTRTDQERSANIPTRIDLPSDYYSDLQNYFEDVSRYPYILNYPENAMAVGIGMYWKDTRIKVINDSLVVELRSLPTQPTIDEDIAMVLMYLGRLTYSQITDEAMLPMILTRQNKHQVMLKGLSANIWYPTERGIHPVKAADILPYEISKAKIGLSMLGIENTVSDQIDILSERLYSGTPSDRMAQKVNLYQKQGASRIQAIDTTLRELKKGI